MPNDQLTEDERIAMEKNEKRKLLARERSKRYYANDDNRKKVLAKQKQYREGQKRLIMNALSKIQRQVPVSNSDTNYDADSDTDLGENEIIYEAPTQKRKMNYTQDQIIELLKQDNDFKSENTRKTYISSVRRIFTMTGCPDMKSCLNSYKKMSNNIEKSDYSTNSIKQTIQAILFISDKYNILHNLFSNKKADDLKKHFTTLFAKFKEKSITELETTQNTVEYPTFTEYLGKLSQIVDKNSKEWLVAKLYSQFTVRDNFANMKIIESINEDNKTDNFLLITRTKILILINKFKTKNKYNRLEFVVTGELKKILNNYIDKHNLSYGDTLFGKSSLSPFVSKMNKKLGYNDLKGVNIYRHMRISELYKGKNITFEERNNLAEQMGHSLLVQKNYKRNLKVV